MRSLHPKPPQVFSAAEAVANNEDLLTEILVRVAAKPLLLFKCVSKRWRLLISSSQFSLTHTRLNRSSVSAVLLCTTQGLVNPKYHFVPLHNKEKPSRSLFNSLNFVEDPDGIKILQSCNGLLLCCSYRKATPFRNYYVYNPTTNQFLTLSPPAADKSQAILGLGLAFDPSKSPYYKVVCVQTTDSSKSHIQAEVYSSDTRSWTRSGSPFIAPFHMEFVNPVFWNGAMKFVNPVFWYFLYFHVEEEHFGAVHTQYEKLFRYARESHGHLHAISNYWPRDSLYVDKMNMDSSKCFVKYRVRFPEKGLNYICPSGVSPGAVNVLCLICEENEADSSLLMHVPGQVISYNLRKKTMKKLCDLSPYSSETSTGSSQFGLLDAYQFIESLAPV